MSTDTTSAKDLPFAADLVDMFMHGQAMRAREIMAVFDGMTVRQYRLACVWASAAYRLAYAAAVTEGLVKCPPHSVFVPQVAQLIDNSWAGMNRHHVTATGTRELKLAGEMVVMGYVMGLDAGRASQKQPGILFGDADILSEVIGGCLSQSEYYPTVAAIAKRGWKIQLANERHDEQEGQPA